DRAPVDRSEPLFEEKVHGLSESSRGHCQPIRAGSQPPVLRRHKPDMRSSCRPRLSLIVVAHPSVKDTSELRDSTRDLTYQPGPSSETMAVSSGVESFACQRLMAG